MYTLVIQLGRLGEVILTTSPENGRPLPTTALDAGSPQKSRRMPRRLNYRATQVRYGIPMRIGIRMKGDRPALLP
jgi:hypothetical protein